MESGGEKDEINRGGWSREGSLEAEGTCCRNNSGLVILLTTVQQR
jgi:hypothetical protein